MIAVGDGIIPFAVANAPADTKFLACVTGDKIVLAICDVAFGWRTENVGGCGSLKKSVNGSGS